jgi:tRNA-2-methylthio-N6-dimethylallyladenosine synthase
MVGRTDRYHKVVFDRGTAKVGDYLKVKITDCTSATLFGDVISE